VRESETFTFRSGSLKLGLQEFIVGHLIQISGELSRVVHE
jgi:hypothetical protein